MEKMQWDDASALSAYDADKYLPRYVTSMQCVFKAADVVFMATDKGQVTGLPLSNTLLSVKNTVGVCCPNVIWMSYTNHPIIR